MRGRDVDDDGLFELYMDACLEGHATEPERFFSDHPELGDEVRSRIEALHRMMRPAESGRARAPESRLEPDDDLPFERLGEYRLLRRLGTGGMGVVYLAEQESLRRVVALKVTRPELRDSPSALERFRREGLAVARLQHPHIVRVLSVGEEGGAHFLAMELVSGQSLADLRRDAARVGRPLPVDEVLRWIEPIARALHHAHGLGVIHRDVKPSNIRATPDGRPKLLDFGIARDEQWRGATLTHAFTGSPLYAAPEQLRGGALDGRTDVYALGVTLYECLTGRLPYMGENMEEAITKTLHEEPIAPRKLRPALSRDVETVVLKAIAKRPPDRYADAGAFADDLLALREGRPVRARPPSAWRRVRTFARRRPAVVATMATVLLAGASALAWARVDRGLRARDALGEARAKLAAYREARDAIAGTEARVEQLRLEIHAKYMTAEEERLYDRAETEMIARRRQREEDFYAVLDLLRRAEQLDAGLDGVDRVRAELFLEKWREAKLVRDGEGMRLYAARVRALAPALAAELEGDMRLLVESDPPGAEVVLFAFREQSDVVDGGERRMVPVPFGAPDVGIEPGRWCLRLARPAQGFRAGDLITSIEGWPIRDLLLVRRGSDDIRRGDRLVAIDGEPARDEHAVRILDGGAHRFTFARGETTFERDGTWDELDVDVLGPVAYAKAGSCRAERYREGAIEEITLPPDLPLRRTAIPLLTHPDAVVGTTPLDILVPRAEYLLLARLDGHVQARTAIMAQDVQGARLTLPPWRDLPEGFVLSHGPERCAQFVMEREVLCSEYLEFLNDPSTLRRIDASPDPILFPRDPNNARNGGYWTRGANGRYAYAGGFEPGWPVLGVSWNDAQAYAAWRSARDGHAYRLLTYQRWVAASTGGLDRTYPFGRRFRPKWIKSCYARPQAMPEDAMSFPIDESPQGLFDTCGSAMEWVDDWYDEPRGLRRVAGGSWGRADPKSFEAWGHGADPANPSGEYGFRLMITVRER